VEIDLPEVSMKNDPARVGEYDLVHRLGEGGQGVVFLGRSASGERVAVKLLHWQLIASSSAREQFAREIEAAKRVARFCTARILDADLDGEHPYIVSEYVDGPSLARLVTEHGPRTGGALDRLAIATATALTSIHKSGIVHRDFKPGNVLVGPDGPRVIDFGIARVPGSRSTLAHQIVGTPAYMAPEQVAGRRITPATDVFAWGATMVYAATGRPPFGSGDVWNVLDRIRTDEPDLGRLSGPLRELAAAALDKEPEARPTARQILLRLLGDDPASDDVAMLTKATQRIEQARTASPARRSAGPWYALTAAILVTGFLLGLLLWPDRADQTDPGERHGTNALATPTPSARTSTAPGRSPGGSPQPRRSSPTNSGRRGIDPAFAGTWSGTMVNPTNGGTFTLRVTFRTGATTGSAFFPAASGRGSCAGDLALSEGTATSMTMSLSVSSPCTPGDVTVSRRSSDRIHFSMRNPTTGRGYAGTLGRT
jgi:eukaryotic-like serine/threonine-protein kinase